MRRLLRILVSALAIGSLLLCLAFAALWVRSYWRHDILGREQPPRPDADGYYLGLESGAGGAAVVTLVYPAEEPDLTRVPGWQWEISDQAPIGYAGVWIANRWGFAYHSSFVHQNRMRVLVFPLWLPTALFAAFPLARGAMFVRRRRRGREGHCTHCGYDLRATPNRCPECGHVPATK